MKFVMHMRGVQQAAVLEGEVIDGRLELVADEGYDTGIRISLTRIQTEEFSRWLERAIDD